MNTKIYNRVHDMPTLVAIIAVILTIVSFFAAAGYENVALTQSEIWGAWGVFAFSLVLTIYILRVWICGRMVAVPSWYRH